VESRLRRQSRIAGLLEACAIGTVFLMPLVFWPAVEFPFSVAKRWLLSAWLLLGFATAVAARIPKRRILPSRFVSGLAVWLSALALSAILGREVSLQALLDAVLPCANALLLVWIAPRTRRVVTALIASATLVASVAILQYFQFDPFRLFGVVGSLQGNSRIQVFSTLGNPNFVASFLVSVLPLTFAAAAMPDTAGRISPLCCAFAALVQAGAIFATGSRAPILAFLAAGSWLLYRSSSHRWRFLAAGLALAAALLMCSPARPLERTIAGRLYVWKVVASHIGEVPLTGFGPGAFPLRFAVWETELLQLNPQDENRSFTGLQDHAHNDYLEFTVDHGCSGLAAFILMLVLLVPVFRGPAVPRNRVGDGIIAAIIALLAVALVDFPLHRPTELFLLWTFIALLWIPGGAGVPDSEGGPEKLSQKPIS
jgi:O-antigen ligase